jgi:hypothetical protein
MHSWDDDIKMNLLEARAMDWINLVLSIEAFLFFRNIDNYSPNYSALRTSRHDVSTTPL